MDEVLDIRQRIVALQRQVYDRFVKIRETMPDAVSDNELDQQRLLLLRAELDLAEYVASSRKNQPLSFQQCEELGKRRQ